jgi:HEAT repeat protein
MMTSHRSQVSASTLTHRIKREYDPVKRYGLLRQLVIRPDAKRYVVQLLRSDDANIRQAIVACLTSDLAQMLSNVLIEALSDSDSRVRKAAAERLYDLEVPQALDPLIALSRDSDPSCVKAAVDALAYFKGKRAAHAVSECLASHHESVRVAAVNALIQIGYQPAASTLERVLDDKAPAVRLRAVQALVLLRNKSSVEAIAALAEDPHPMVQETAVSALGSLADARGAPTLLRTARTARDALLRRVAVEGMGRLRDPETASYLVTALYDTDVDVRCAAADALTERHQLSAITPLSAAAERERDLSARRHFQQCVNALRNRPKHRRESRGKQDLLWRNWYSEPSLDADSLIYVFRPDGTGQAEDFAMGITREAIEFRYWKSDDHIYFIFEDRVKPTDIQYKIIRSKYRSPTQGLLSCLKLEFANEPYFKQRHSGVSFYYHVFYPGR